jgi:hypothetical protein
VANAMRARRRARGQVLVFFALILPLVLLPIAAYAIDAAVTSSAYSELVAATATAAEDAAQQIDVAKLRLSGVIALDRAQALAVAEAQLAGTGAHLDSVDVQGRIVHVTASRIVRLPLDFVGGGSVGLSASATARLAPGYDSPSSRLPLPLNSF